MTPEPEPPPPPRLMTGEGLTHFGLANGDVCLGGVCSKVKADRERANCKDGGRGSKSLQLWELQYEERKVREEKT